MKNNSKKVGALTLGALLVSSAWAGGLDAADSLDAASAPILDRTDSAAVPSVTVSATRRNASLQSVPVAVSVLNGDDLAQANRTSIDTIVQEVPSVTFRQQGGNKDSTIFVRGIGTIQSLANVRRGTKLVLR